MASPDELTLSGWFTGLFILAALYVTGITLSSRQIDTKRVKYSKGDSFVCGVIVVSSWTASSVSAPATRMFDTMNGETQKRSFCG